MDKPTTTQLNDLISGDTPPDQHGRRCPVKLVEAAKVGNRGEAVTLYRVNFFVDAWNTVESLYPSTRIWRSFFISFDGISITDETIKAAEVPTKFQATN
jgi:hypothetical protein